MKAESSFEDSSATVIDRIFRKAQAAGLLPPDPPVEAASEPTPQLPQPPDGTRSSSGRLREAEYYGPILSVLEQHGGKCSKAALEAALETVLPLNDIDRIEVKPGVPFWKTRVSWAITALRKQQQIKKSSVSGWFELA